MNKQDFKKDLFSYLLNVKENYNKKQPWLHLLPVELRPIAKGQEGVRLGEDGKRRGVRASDLPLSVDCERRFATTLLGIHVYLGSPLVYRGQAGTIVHNELERLLPAHVNTGNRNKKASFIYLPSIGRHSDKDYTGKNFSGIAGQYDGYSALWRAGIELKTIPEGEPLPDTLPSRAAYQSSLYAAGIQSKRGAVDFWAVIYPPQDLTKFDPRDIATYRVFIMEADDLNDSAALIFETSRKVSEILTNMDDDLEAAKEYLKCYSPGTCEYCLEPW